ncbi:MAG: undecaprenyldiphospho-muramoylpentapeptide beta-N-acetylglucosaminyltransferase [Tenuifilaceae bacterium]|jgi:UDP-N-acetylglucosamine--N-acetylmuramyl-(pentapeptide) pyrophosphoryl-undecaprenol N-acetylglucosamine transferase|nr:undecaprenyldiphospho-muramoylpentapeptide beta-N-acetylglucosaminyltransferase [Bacteroidales bacterium]MDI9515877.1 undecaprenyldiphospho-muramoylpentapeptide beta-N-acetylglucosaminyltransferase [Bacteroidota bacterium]OQC62143.1 MAG: UDP-N-acetylglucosamine--N-acetylmuramyl-(pentapeptide) pyrophosphoryl-undecaprenol N-acetylglucosamine transferase [Bacteroidetes bacterium ADurb.Bin008]HNV81573.1 undecaprenyldiphospho-muramoylpentapeptide beta-N-acetylglucosaminyltransferase [Tenuifilaceae
MEKKSLKVIISGGGTGGHIFPAISIANALREINPGVDILFVGAEGRMEMEKVPASGYPIVGLPVVGLQRKLTLKNISFVFKLLRSTRMASSIVAKFKPDVVVGVGGYASGPILRVAQRKGVPTLIQEQNSYAGITNRLLAKRAKAICVAYEGMDKYFPANKIVITGNPVRQGIDSVEPKAEEAMKFFEIPAGNRVILVVGGSLGARTINQSVLKGVEEIEKQQDIILIWQTGKLYYDGIRAEMALKKLKNVRLFDFINRMDLAYATADLVISRAGACTISELCLVGKPAILVPSPNVAEDHQTKNANALVKKGAAALVPDSDAPDRLVSKALELVSNPEALKGLALNVKTMALPDAAAAIAGKVLEIAKGKTDIQP